MTNAFVAISTCSSSTRMVEHSLFMIYILNTFEQRMNRKMVINACSYSGLLSYCSFIVANRKILTVNDIKRKPIPIVKMTLFRYRCPSNPNKRKPFKMAAKSNQKCSINITRHHSPVHWWLRYLWYARLLFLSYFFLFFFCETKIGL